MKLLGKIIATSGQIVKELRQYLETHPDFCVRFYFEGDAWYVQSIDDTTACEQKIVILRTTSDEDCAMTVESLIEQLEGCDEESGVLIDYCGLRIIDLEDDKIFQFEENKDNDYVDIWFFVGGDIRAFSAAQLLSDLENFSNEYVDLPVRFVNDRGNVFSLDEVDSDKSMIYLQVIEDADEPMTVGDLIEELSSYSAVRRCKVIQLYDYQHEGESRTINQLPDGHIFYVEEDENGEKMIVCQLGELLEEEDDEDWYDNYDDEDWDDEDDEDDNVDDGQSASTDDLKHKWMQMVKEARQMVNQVEDMDDMQKCIDLLLPPAMAAVPVAMFMMSMVNKVMEESAKEKQWANALMSMDPDNEDADVLWAKGIVFECGLGDYEENIEYAISYYKAAAEKGHPDALCSIAELYYRGEGLPKDPKAALMWAKNAYEEDNAYGIFIYGRAYYEGAGVPKDKTLGKQLLRQAASMSESESMGSVEANDYIIENEI